VEWHFEIRATHASWTDYPCGKMHALYGRLEACPTFQAAY